MSGPPMFSPDGWFSTGGNEEPESVAVLIDRVLIRRLTEELRAMRATLSTDQAPMPIEARPFVGNQYDHALSSPAPDVFTRIRVRTTEEGIWFELWFADWCTWRRFVSYTAWPPPGSRP